MGDPAASQSPQSGASVAVDGVSTTSPTGEWVVPPPGTKNSPAVSGAASVSLALLNTSAGPGSYHAFAPTTTGDHVVATGTAGRRQRGDSVGIAADGRRIDPILVHASGPMAVSVDVGPSAGLGVVSVPGIPLAAAIGA